MEDKIKKDIQEIQDFKSDSIAEIEEFRICLLYTSPSPRD